MGTHTRDLVPPKIYMQSRRWTLLHAANSQGRDVRAKEQVPSDLQVPKPPGSLYSLLAAGATLQRWVPGGTDTPGTRWALLAATVEAAPTAARRRQVPVTRGDQDGRRRVLGAKGQTTLKGNKKIPKLLSRGTVPTITPAQGLTFSSAE